MRALRGPLQVPVHLHGLLCQSEEEELSFNWWLGFWSARYERRVCFCLSSQKATSSSDQSLLPWVENYTKITIINNVEFQTEATSQSGRGGRGALQHRTSEKLQQGFAIGICCLHANFCPTLQSNSMKIREHGNTNT